MNRAEKGGKLVKKSKGIEPPQPKKYWSSQRLKLSRLYLQEFLCNAVTTDKDTPTQSSSATRNFGFYRQNLMRNHSTEE